MPRPVSVYGPHEVLVAPGRPGRALWRLLGGLGIVVVVMFALNSLANSVLSLLMPDYWRTGPGTRRLLGADPLSMLILLGSFAFLIVGTGVAARLMQRRDLAGMIGPVPLAVMQFWRVFRLLVLLGVVVVVLPPWDMGAPLVSNLPLGRWLMLLPLSLIGVAIQVGAEEILFRGYIQQSLAARFSSPLVWMVLPSALFALGHYMPAETGDNALLIALWAGMFGCLTADLTARAGTLGPAIAMHLAINITGLLLVALPGALSGLALYLAGFAMSDSEPMRAWLLVDFALMLVSWLVSRLALGR